MWPYRNQSQTNNPWGAPNLNDTANKQADKKKDPSPYAYNPTLYPPSFKSPTAHHILSLPTPAHPGYGSYSSNPFTQPVPLPKLPQKAQPQHPYLPNQSTPPPQPEVQAPSAFYTPTLYRDETNTHASNASPHALRTATPQPHLRFRPAFGVSGFLPPAPNQLAYKPFESSVRTHPQPSAEIQNRPFGYQPRPAFPSSAFHSSSRFNPAKVLEEKEKERKGLLPSEEVRRRLDGVEEEKEGVGKVGSGIGKKRKRSLLPSEKVRKRLAGLGPREAWDPDSP